MKVVKKRKEWMEKMYSVDVDVKWCCNEAKKHLSVFSDGSNVYFNKYSEDNMHEPLGKDILINYCPFCGEKVDV